MNDLNYSANEEWSSKLSNQCILFINSQKCILFVTVFWLWGEKRRSQMKTFYFSNKHYEKNTVVILQLYRRPIDLQLWVTAYRV